MQLPDYNTFLQERQQVQQTRQQQLATLNSTMANSGQQYAFDPTDPNKLLLVSTPTNLNLQGQVIQNAQGFAGATGVPVSSQGLQNQINAIGGGATPGSASSQQATAQDLLPGNAGQIQSNQTGQQGQQSPFSLVNPNPVYLTPADRSKISSALPILETDYNDLSTKSSKVNTQGPLTAWLSGTVGEALGQNNQDIVSLKNTRADLLGLIKGLTGVGRITQQEIEYLDKYLLPNPTDTQANAQDKLTRLNGWIQTLKSDIGQASTGTPAGTQSPQSFPDEASAAKANLAPGTKIIVGGVSGTWQ